MQACSWFQPTVICLPGSSSSGLVWFSSWVGGFLSGTFYALALLFFGRRGKTLQASLETEQGM